MFPVPSVRRTVFLLVSLVKVGKALGPTIPRLTQCQRSSLTTSCPSVQKTLLCTRQTTWSQLQVAGNGGPALPAKAKPASFYKSRLLFKLPPFILEILGQRSSKSRLDEGSPRRTAVLFASFLPALFRYVKYFKITSAL